jgi:Na+/proline symporter
MPSVARVSRAATGATSTRLSLAVYCTSWTFYGTVTQAARYGLAAAAHLRRHHPAVCARRGVLLRLVRWRANSNATSIADLIATRLGKDAWLAAAVTRGRLLGMIPYLALQLKAVAMSFAC